MNRERPCFIVRKAVFYTLKGRLLEDRRRHIRKYLTIKQLAAELIYVFWICRLSRRNKPDKR